MTAKWTVMVYLAGNNSLTSAAGADLREMRRVGSTAAVNIMAFVKRKDHKGARRMRIHASAPEVVDGLGDVDSGDPKTVEDFIAWGIASAPADRYALILWNHGGGWKPDDYEQIYSAAGRDGSLSNRELEHRATDSAIARAIFSTTAIEILSQPSAGERQILNDDGTGHSLDTLELGKVLQASAISAGKPIDLLGMDACLMSGLEVAYEARDSTRVVVGSEELEPGAGWPYHRILAQLNLEPDVDAPSLARLIVTQYVESFRNSPAQWPVTQSAIDTAKARAFAESLDGLVDALTPLLPRRWSSVVRAQQKAVHFYYGLIDLATFCESLKDIRDPKVTKAVGAVREALRPGGYVIAEAHLGKKVDRCAGVTVYMPSAARGVSKYYSDLQFAKQHRWDDFLLAWHRASRGSGP